MVSHALGKATSETRVIDSVAVSVPSDLLAEIDALVGVDQRAAFVRAALEERLKRMQRVRAFVGHVSASDAPHWATEESTAAWLREIRDWPDRWADSSADAEG